MRGERIAAPLFALLIVISGAGGAIAPGASPVGTAAAQDDSIGGTCGTADWALSLIIGPLATFNCDTGTEVAEEWNETNAKQTRTQIHSQAGQLAAGNEQFLIGMNNALTDSNTIAFSKGEAAAVEVLANGGTVAEAQQAANGSIEDYYTVKQRNLVDRWDVNVQTIKTLAERADNTTGVREDFITAAGESDLNGRNATGSFDGSHINTTSTTTAQLSNGSSVTAETLGVTSYNTGGEVYHTWFNTDLNDTSLEYETVEDKENIWITTYLDGGEVAQYGSVIRVRPTENLSSKTAVDYEEFGETWESIETRQKQTKEEVAVYINESLAPAVESGDLNASSYVSPATLAQEYAQEYGNDSSYIRATAIATYAGMDAPDLTNTGSMTISYNGSTYEGLLLSQEAPSGGWESGQSYDPALLSGLQMFAVAGDNGEIIQLDQSFTVEKVTGTDGQEIDKATTINVTYETSNASANYTELQQQIRALNEQIQERQAAATTGGSDVETNNGLIAKIAAALGVGSGVVLVGAAAVVVVAARVYLPDS